MFKTILDSITASFRSPSAPPAPLTSADPLGALVVQLDEARAAAEAATLAADAAREAIEPAARIQRDAARHVLDALAAGRSDEDVDALQRAAAREEARYNLAVRRADEATAADEAAAAQVEELERAIADAGDALALAEAERTASLDTFKTRAAPHFNALVAALAEVERQAGEIDAIFDETNEAAEACQRAGRNVPRLDSMHKIVPVALRRGIVPKDDGILGMRNSLTCGKLAATILDGLKAVEDRGRAYAEQECFRERRIAEIETMLGARTWIEALALVDAARRAAKEADAPAELARQAAQRAEYEATQRRLRGSTEYEEDEERRLAAKEAAARSYSVENIGEVVIETIDEEAMAEARRMTERYAKRAGDVNQNGMVGYGSGVR